MNEYKKNNPLKIIGIILISSLMSILLLSIISMIHLQYDYYPSDSIHLANAPYICIGELGSDLNESCDFSHFLFNIVFLFFLFLFSLPYFIVSVPTLIIFVLLLLYFYKIKPKYENLKSNKIVYILTPLIQTIFWYITFFFLSSPPMV